MTPAALAVLPGPLAPTAQGEMDATEGLLQEVARGDRGPLARVFRPPPTLAFGRLDERRPGIDDARERAAAHGFAPVRRLGGGQAAAYHDGCVVVEAITPVADIASGTSARFDDLAAVIVAVLRGHGAPAAVGELPGEYCPGRHSVHVAGTKVAGIAQRAVRGAALTTGFVAVTGGASLRAVLVEVYAALDRPWDPGTAGAAEDHVPGLEASDVVAGLEARLTAWPPAGGWPGPTACPC